MLDVIRVKFPLIDAILMPGTSIDTGRGHPNKLRTGARAEYLGGGWWEITSTRGPKPVIRAKELLIELGWKPPDDRRLFFVCTDCGELHIVKDQTVYRRKGVHCGIGHRVKEISHKEFYAVKKAQGKVGVDLLTPEQAFQLKYAIPKDGDSNK